MTQESLLEAVARSVAGEPEHYVGFYPALVRHFDNVEYEEALRRAHCYPDGMGALLAMRAQGHAVPRRLATTDVIWPILEMAERQGFVVGIYGGTPDVAFRAVEAIRSRHPKLDVCVHSHGFVDVDPAMAARQWSQDLLIVGRGAPVQDVWGYRYHRAGGRSTLLTCGGLLDFIAEEQRRAPMWMQRWGLEWLFRVMREPKRLAARYFLGNSQFVFLVLRGRLRFTPAKPWTEW